ncbi:MAG: hypothetical protein H0X41_06120 [Chitinophagaceae bacterium]|nr:hypothetical protein [Chitinophagaceae bacterium]
MKATFTLPAIVLLTITFFSACTKQDYISSPSDEEVWVRSHEKGSVAYVDTYAGNYIVETYNGYSVVQSSGGIVPRENDTEYAWFSSQGNQTIYNYDGNYYTQERIVQSYLTWSDALIILDNISH